METRNGGRDARPDGRLATLAAATLVLGCARAAPALDIAPASAGTAALDGDEIGAPDAATEDVQASTPQDAAAADVEENDEHAACASYGTPECPHTGDPLPQPGTFDNTCPDGSGERWLGSNPHNPFVIVRDGELIEANHRCCAPWSVRDSKWHGIDAYGQIVGTSAVVRGEGYDVTRCFELTLEVESGERGVGLFVQRASQPARSFRYEPSSQERLSFEALLQKAEAFFLPPGLEVLPAERAIAARRAWKDHVLFFRDTARNGRPTVYAVVGGPLLLVARLNERGVWVQEHVEPPFSDSYLFATAYEPLAVFDIDRDDVAEIVIAVDAGDSFWQSVLERDGDQGTYVVVADSVGGATL